MIKVLLVVENHAAPADTRVWLEARTLRDAGYGVSIISPRGERRDRARFERVEGISIYRYALPQAGSLAGYLVEYLVALWMTLWLSLRVWRRHGFDVMHVANPPDIFFLLALLYKPFGKRFVFDQHDLAPELFSARFPGRDGLVVRVAQRALRAAERLSYRAADLAIVTNESFRRFAIARHAARPERVRVVRNAPDPRRISRVAPDPSLKGAWRYLLAYVGVMGPQDGVEYAIYALNELVHRQGRREVGLVLLGDGAELPALCSLATALGLDDNIRFAGWVEPSEISRYLSTADVGICPDPQNGVNEHCTMIKAMEYMALGLPIVAFDLEETRISARDAALYARPNRIREFAALISTLLDDAALRERMGAHGRQRLESELSEQVARHSLLAAYAECVPGAKVEGTTRRHATWDAARTLMALGGVALGGVALGGVALGGVALGGVALGALRLRRGHASSRSTCL